MEFTEGLTLLGLKEVGGLGAIKWTLMLNVAAGSRKLPQESHVVVYQAILNLINAFQYFTQVYVITTASDGVTSGASGGPENSILMYPLYLFHNAFIYMKMGRASAMAWVLFAIVGVLTIIMMKITKKTVAGGAGGE